MRKRTSFLAAIVALGGFPSAFLPGAGQAGTVIAGRVYSAGETYLLDISGAKPAILKTGPDGRMRRELELAPTSARLDPYGLALSAEGLFWALADKGSVLVGFDPRSGAVADVRPIPTHCIAVWGVEGVVMVAALQLTGEQPLLLQMTADGFRPCGAIRTRPVRGTLDAPILAMFTCGASRTAVLPCWWIAGDARVIHVRASCASKTVPAPSLVVARNPSERGTDPIEQFDYPIRDVFAVDDRHVWLLTNQEGSSSPVSERGVAGRHLLFVSEGRSEPERVVPLPRKARFILDGDSRWVSVLYADGTVERIALP